MATSCSQSINFYQTEFRKPVVVLPVRQMLAISGLVFAGLLFSGIYLQWSLKSLNENIALTQTQKVNLQQRLDHLQKTYVQPQEDPALLSSLDMLNRHIRQQEELKQFLDKESGKITFSFSDVMRDLAQNDSKRIWLNRIEIQSTGNHYQLHGMTQYADAIPEYIGLLKTADSLKGSAFSLFNLERDRQRPSLFYFTLSSESEE